MDESSTNESLVGGWMDGWMGGWPTILLRPPRMLLSAYIYSTYYDLYRYERCFGATSWERDAGIAAGMSRVQSSQVMSNHQVSPLCVVAAVVGVESLIHPIGSLYHQHHHHSIIIIPSSSSSSSFS